MQPRCQTAGTKRATGVAGQVSLSVVGRDVTFSDDFTRIRTHHRTPCPSPGPVRTPHHLGLPTGSKPLQTRRGGTLNTGETTNANLYGFAYPADAAATRFVDKVKLPLGGGTYGGGIAGRLDTATGARTADCVLAAMAPETPQVHQLGKVSGPV